MSREINGESSATALAQHRSLNSNYIPIDHPSNDAPTLQGNGDVAEARYERLNTLPNFGVDNRFAQCHRCARETPQSRNET